MRQSSGKNAQLFRCHFDDVKAIELALASLRDRGHRRIGLLYTHGKVEWMQHRLRLLMQTGHRIAPEMTLVSACLEDEFGVFDDMRNERSRQVDLFDFDSFIRRFGVEDAAAGNVPAPAHAAHLLWKKAGSLRELLRTHRVTAMIAPNDFYQQKVYLWATNVGLHVPKDLSLVSFDNSTESFIFPLASIDPGFSYLGYLAAHLFIGDIAVPADRWGDIPGRCRLVDRGSLATPRESEKAIEALG
jgi:DNA-binding LacI/PurR family transcriptional regulator